MSSSYNSSDEFVILVPSCFWAEVGWLNRTRTAAVCSLQYILQYIIFISLSVDKFKIKYLHEIGRFAFDVQHWRNSSIFSEVRNHLNIRQIASWLVGKTF